MPDAQPHNLMKLETVIQEIDHATARLEQAAIVDQKRELLDNAYPLLKLVVENLGVRQLETVQRLDEVEAAVAEYLTSQESMILPELAAQIQTVLALAMTFCDTVNACEVWGKTEATRAKKMPEDLRNQMVILKRAAGEVRDLVDEVTLVDEGAEEEAAAAFEALKQATEQPGFAPEAPTNEEATDAATS